jgi:type IV pilus assembly protein PilM
MRKGVWGLNISKSSLKAVRLENKGGGIELTDIDIIEYPPAASRDERAFEEEMSKALSLFKSKHNIGRDMVVVSLPSHSAFNRFIKLPTKEPDKLKEFLQTEIRQHLPFEIEEVIWRYQIIEKGYQQGEEIDAVLFAIKKEIVNKILAILNGVKIKVDILQFAPVALYNFIRAHGDFSDKNMVIIDIGATNTDLILVNEDNFWIRNLPVIGNDLTKAIHQKFNVSFEEAEKLKVFAAQSNQSGKIFNAIQPVLKELTGEIQRSITYYKSLSTTSKTAIFNKIIVLGNSTRVVYFDEFISQQLKMDITRLKKTGNIQIGVKVDQAALSNQMLSLGTGLGLALQGLAQTANIINLLPDEILRQRKIEQKKKYISFSMIILALIVVVLYVSAVNRYSSFDNLYKDSQNITKQWRDDVKKLEQAKKVEEIEGKIGSLIKNIPNRNIWGKILREINNVPAIKNNFLPDSGYIEKNDAEALNAFKEYERGKIWILKLEANRKDSQEAEKKTIELIVIGAVSFIQENDDPENYKKIIRKRFLQPLAQALDVVIVPVPEIMGGPVGELKSDEESPDATRKKYYRFKAVLDIPK